MKTKILYLSFAICMVIAFWACGSGELEWAGDDDVLALEKYDNVTEGDILLALKNCKGDPQCKEEVSKAFFDKPFKDKDTIPDEDTVYSSSGVKASSSSAKCDSCLLSSSSDSLLSSAGLDSLVSSSSADTTASSASDSTDVSSSSVKSSSSEASSSSVVESSSSFYIPKLSSSSKVIEESSSSEEEENKCTTELLEGGLCQVSKSTAKLGEQVTWTYVLNAPECEGATIAWELTESKEFQLQGFPSVTFTLADANVGDKVSPTGTLKKGSVTGEFDCLNVPTKIAAGTVPVSSSSIVQSSSTVVPTTSSTVINSSSSKTQPGECEFDPIEKWLCKENGKKCVQNDAEQWVCPATTQSSSSIVPSSSSIVPSSSSVVLSSSSSEEPPPESSSSVGPSGPIEITLSGSLTSGLIANQDYSVTHSCSQKMQVMPPQGNGSCHVIIDGQTMDVGWDLQLNTSPGTYMVSSDCDDFAMKCW
jgi:hypothetical protein